MLDEESDFHLASSDFMQNLSQRLRARGQRLCTIESCTGGWVAQLATDLAGSSDWFECGWVTYSNDAKIRDVKVPHSVINEFGAVSRETAEAMVRGGCATSGAAIGISITGVAGPGGGSPEKPVGTVCFAWAIENRILSHRQQFIGSRRDVRQQSVLHALSTLIDILDKPEPLS